MPRLLSNWNRYLSVSLITKYKNKTAIVLQSGGQTDVFHIVCTAYFQILSGFVCELSIARNNKCWFNVDKTTSSTSSFPCVRHAGFLVSSSCSIPFPTLHVPLFLISRRLQDCSGIGTSAQQHVNRLHGPVNVLRAISIVLLIKNTPRLNWVAGPCMCILSSTRAALFAGANTDSQLFRSCVKKIAFKHS